MKNSSFTVNDEKGFYHCFSTGEHGNIFDFLMKTKSVRFGEAVKSLAAEAGMPIFKFTKFDKEKEERFNKYKLILKDYCEYFQNELLLREIILLNYLKERKLSEEIIKKFQLGYVPQNNNFFQQLSNKYSLEEIKQTGLYFL